MTPAERIRASLARESFPDRVTGRRRPMSDAELPDALARAWDGLLAPGSEAAAFVVGLGLLACGRADVLPAVLERLPMAGPTRHFVPMLEALVPFPADRRPGLAPDAARAWAADARLAFEPTLGRHQVVPPA